MNESEMPDGTKEIRDVPPASPMYVSLGMGKRAVPIISSDGVQARYEEGYKFEALELKVAVGDNQNAGEYMLNFIGQDALLQIVLEEVQLRGMVVGLAGLIGWVPGEREQENDDGHGMGN